MKWICWILVNKDIVGNEMTKMCTKCGETKDVGEFYRNGKYKDGYMTWCKSCLNAYTYEWRKNNIEKSREMGRRCYKKHAQEYNEVHRKYCIANPEKRKQTAKNWYDKNIDRAKEASKKYRENNREKRRELAYSWRKKNPERWRTICKKYEAKINKQPKRKLNINVSCMIRNALKANKTGRHWETLTGYTLEQLIKHLEKQFDKNMTWDNYGSYWSVDHILPLSVHNFTEPENIDFKRAWALKNLRPLEKIANIKKSNKLSKPFQPALQL